jgi:hypothetical protein
MSQIELVSSGKRLAQINIISGSLSKQKKTIITEKTSGSTD